MHEHACNWNCRARGERKYDKKRIQNKGQTFHKFGEKNQLTILRSSANPKQEEYKENHT